MTDCREQSWLFQDLGNRKVEVDFGGGYLSSDGGGLILRELERHSGLLRDFSGCFVDYRDQSYVEHSVQQLVSQRIHGLVLSQSFGVKRRGDRYALQQDSSTARGDRAVSSMRTSEKAVHRAYTLPHHQWLQL